MRSISFRTVLIAAAIGFFALGVVTTLRRPRQAPPSFVAAASTARPVTVQPSDGTPQVGILILGVDTLDREEGELLAAWIASFRPTGKELYLFGFTTDRPLPGGSTLREAYAESPREPASLASVTALPIDAVIVLDSQGFARLIDFLGGVPTAETPVDGAAALQVLSLLRDDPGAALLAQARLLEALSGNAGTVQPGMDLQPVLDLAPDHASVDVPAEELLTKVAPYLPLASDRVHVYLPIAPTPAPDG